MVKPTPEFVAATWPGLAHLRLVIVTPGSRYTGWQRGIQISREPLGLGWEVDPVRWEVDPDA